ncbi:MAG: butyrate kinase, partial [Rikenellaceae bacterium]|nr:butyrate kinase [Rikenellaceae bacterium]
TKIALFENETEIFEKTLRHSNEELAPYPKITDQFSFRKDLILEALRQEGVALGSIDAVVGRGGLVKPIPSGVYEMNEALVRDLIDAPMGEHASNLGGLIARDLAKQIGHGARAFIADPVVVDEMQDVARISGHPEVPRLSIFHALNQKAVARMYAQSIDKKYEELNLIVAHLGGGISVAAHEKGRVIDVNNALYGEGPFSPERVGTLSAGQVIDLCFSGKYTYSELKKQVAGKGGVVAWLGTNDMRTVRERAASGDTRARLIVDAMGYAVAKEIGAMAAVLSGRVDAILLTGGIVHGQTTREYIRKRVEFIAPVAFYPGEDEMRALAMNGLRVLTGDTVPKVYS